MTPSIRVLGLTILLIAATAALADPTPSSADWTQWGGPHRDFATNAPAPDAWPEDGPKLEWSRDLGDGFSSIISDGETLYTMYSTDDAKEVVVALSAKDGTQQWEYRYDTGFIDEGKDRKHQLKFGKGPNSTPLLVDGRLYAIGFAAKLHCLDAKTGKVIWKKDLLQDMKGTFLQFGYAASPLAYDNMVIVLVGGIHQGVVAFDQKTGDIRWQSTDFDASYSSPILTDVDGDPHVIAFMAKDVIGMDPRTGDVHWTVPYKNQFNTSINTPVAFGANRIYFVNGSDEGGRVIELYKDKGHILPKPIWQNPEIKTGLNNQVLIGDTFYGGAGERKSIMMAFDANTGKIAWQERGFDGIKGVACDDGKMVLLDNKGELMLVAVSPKGVEVKSRKTVLEDPSWTVPTIVGHHIYVRDRKKIVALEQ